MPAEDRALIFGATGALGQAVVRRLEVECSGVLLASRRRQRGVDVVTPELDWARAQVESPVDRVVWVQGVNSSDPIDQLTPERVASVLDANVLYVVETLHELLAAGLLAHGARLVVVSSVWQELARSKKAAYITSKAAVGGLVRALAVDLGDRGYRVNAVLPGVVDTPMTREFLSESAIAAVAEGTPGGVLVSADDVAEVCAWLSSPSSAGVNGQSLVVDGGWAVCRRV